MNIKSIITTLAIGVTTFVAQAQTFNEPGIQLYSLRDSFKQEGAAKTLDKVVAFGFTQVETAGVEGVSHAELRKLLDERKLVAQSGFWDFDRIDKDINAVIAEAKILGCRFVGCAWIPHSVGNFNEADARRAIEVFNRAGQEVKKAGMRFFYHNHGYEFKPHGDGTLFDLMAQELIPGVVDFQLDVMWVQHPGHDPVKLLEKYPNRFLLCHIKDWKKGMTGNLTGQAPKEECVVVGTGVSDWPAIYAAAKKNGTTHFYLEDEAPNVEQQIPASLEYLKTIK